METKRTSARAKHVTRGMTAKGCLAILAVISLGASPIAGHNGAGSGIVAKIVAHHLAAARMGDVDALMQDYAEDAFLILPDQVVKGKASIRATFQHLIGGNSAATHVRDGKIVAQTVMMLAMSRN
jgi:hypothetical protein